MTEEKKIIEYLSFESEKLSEDFNGKYPIFDTEISAWKETPSSNQNIVFKVVEPVRIRIRTIENRKELNRNSSSKLYSGTFSSSNPSRSNSPGSEQKCKKNLPGLENTVKKVVSFTLYQNTNDFQNKNEGPNEKNSIRIYKPKHRRKRKPIKVFRLPNVTQGEEYE